MHWRNIPGARIATTAALAYAILAFLGIEAPRAQGNIRVSGLVDIVAHSDDDMLYLNQTNLRDSNFDPLRARLFIEGGTENTQVFLQTLFSQESFSRFRLVGAYLLHRVTDSPRLYFEAGLIPTHD